MAKFTEITDNLQVYKQVAENTIQKKKKLSKNTQLSLQLWNRERDSSFLNSFYKIPSTL